LPRGTTSTLQGSSSLLSGRRVKEDHHEGWKIEEDKKKEQKKTYLLVPEPEASPGSSVPAFGKLSDTIAATSALSSGTAAAPPTPRGRGKGAGGTESQGSKDFIDTNFNGALHAQN
jgi:hypothetical protein